MTPDQKHFASSSTTPLAQSMGASQEVPGSAWLRLQESPILLYGAGVAPSLKLTGLKSV